MALPPTMGNVGESLTIGAVPTATSMELQWQNTQPQTNIFQVRTQSSQNINTDAISSIQWDLAPDINDGIYALDANNINLVITATGRYEIYANIVTTSKAVRSNAILKFVLNGAELPGQACSGYIRASSGHNESNGNMRTIALITAGSVLSVTTQREAASGTITMIPDESVWIVKTI